MKTGTLTALSTRVRFAPSPTGFMHLGNVRAALMNFLFARQSKGSFIVRIEDTDPQRNVDPNGTRILFDLNWMGLFFDEGPGIGGPYAPYMQSERSGLYQEYLLRLQDHGQVYRCFCTQEELEKKRERQIALKMPPRYDRTCLKLSAEKIQEMLEKSTPFIWRFKLPDVVIEIKDLARGAINFDLKNFSDFALTRADQSFTFIFANCVDDIIMKITHVLRGEDHLSNTALQAALYKAFGATIPGFWHLPIIINSEGKKLSKRDFGFSLGDLRDAGYVPEAIVNYLAIIGASFTQEIMSLSQLISTIDFKVIASAGHIRYDLEKLRWINHKWVEKLSLQDLAGRCRPFLEQVFPAAKELSSSELEKLVGAVRQELVTLADSSRILEFYFKEPEYDLSLINTISPQAKQLLVKKLESLDAKSFDSIEFIDQITALAKQNKIPAKDIFALIRFALTGSVQGMGVKDLFALLSNSVAFNRLSKLAKSL